MQILRRSRWSWLLAAGVVLHGCGPHSESGKSGVEGGPPSTPSSAPQSARDVRLEFVSCHQWDEALAAYRGKIVVVDTWATWCNPCREEFPHLVALHHRHATDGVVCMSVSVDEAEQYGEAVDFLKQQGATFPNYLIQDKDDNAWWDKWNIKGIPIVLVFDRDGKLAKKFDRDDPDNQFTYADVEKLVTDLLSRGGS